MSYPILLTQSQIFTAFRSVMLAAFQNLEIIQGQDNRVSSPNGANYIVFTPLFFKRLSTNIDTYADCVFTGSTTTNILTISNVGFGTVAIGSTLYGPSVSAGTTITQQLSGTTGGAGTYTISPNQSVASGILASGVVDLLQQTELTVQVDTYGPNSADNCQVVSTLFRSNYCYDLFAAQGYDIQPLYADDPRQTPFLDGEQQIEKTWHCDIKLQVNQAIQVPQQFAGSLSATIKNPADSYPH